MANTNDDVIIVGSLSDNEMRKAIDDLVSYVGDQTTLMAGKFTKSIDLMRDAMKDFAVTQKVSVDLMKQAWREMSSSFDAMVAAQSQSTGGSGGGGGSNATPDSVKALKEDIAAAEQMRDTLQQWSPQLYAANEQIEKMRNNLNSMLAKGTLKEKMADARKELGDATSMPTKNLGDAQRKLATLEALQQKYKNTTLLSVQQTNRLATAIQTCKDKIDKLNQTKPQKLSDVLGMDENSFDSITKKMSALKKLTWSDDNEKNTIIANYQRLREEQNKLLSSNAKMARSNNYLAQSFGYIRNRIVYALTLGAITSFTKQIYEIRGQYELLERSLGVLLNSFEKGSQVFQELNQMAIESPFTLMELAGAAKQLTAYNFAANEVVDTTRRLADISAALGVPMERLTYNLGQIRAQTVLNARDARDFANAGLPIVKSLSDYYTELEGKIVSTGDVYDRMSKKMVSYTDVMAVLNKMTDEGGKFFEFQAKQAETLRVQMANLTLAWNNMLNEMGKGNQTLLSLPIKGLKALLQNWSDINRVLKNVILSFGLLRVTQMIAIRHNWQLAVSAGGAARMMGFLGNAVKGLAASFGALMANPWTGISVGIFAFVDLIGQMRAAKQATAELNEEIRNGATEASQANLDFLGNKGNKATLELAKQNKLTAEQGEKAWQAIEQQISTSAMSANKLLGELWAIDDINERVRKGFEYTESIQQAQAALQDLQEDTITLTRDKGWFGVLGEGLVSDLKDLQEELDGIAGGVGMFDKEGKLKDISAGFTEYRKELEKTAESINNFIIEHKITDPLQINEILERVKTVIKTKNPEIKGELATLFDVTLDQRMMFLTNGAIDQNSSLWKMFLDRLKHNYSSTFQSITNDIYKENANLSKEQQEAVDANLEYFKKTMPFYYDAIESMVSDASKLRINIGVTFGVQKLTDFQDQVRDRISKASSVLDFGNETMWGTQNDDLQSWVKTQQGAIKSLQEQNKLYAKDQSQWAKDQIAANNIEIKQRKNLLDLFNQSHAEEKKQKGGRGRKDVDIVAEALKQEIQLINDMRSNYDKLRKAGVSDTEAMTLASKGYEMAILRINSILQKFGIDKFNARNFAGKNVRELLDNLTKQRDALLASGKVKTSSLKDLDIMIQKLTVDAKTFDMKKITDGLNSELGKLKDEYELAIELDANPELGGIFADMMGIDESQLQELPRNFNDVMNKLQSIIDSKLGSGRFDLSRNLSKAALDEWLKLNRQGEEQDDALAKMLNTFREYANKVRIDETKKQINEWNKLLEKYAEYEYKVTQIQKEAERERETARKKGASQEIVDAIDKKEREELSKAAFEEFQKTSDWVVATGDLAKLSKNAIGMLIDELEKYKRTAKYLEPKQIKQLNSALSKLYKEQRKNNPFAAISNMLQEAKELAATYQQEIDEVQKEMEDLGKKSIGGLTDDEQIRLDELIKKWELLKKKQKAAGKVDATEWVSSINTTISAVKQAVGVFDDLAKAIGGVNTSDVDKVFSILEKGGQGAAIGAQIGGGYGAVIGAAAGVLTGIITEFADAWSGNAYISEQVEKSILSVKRLENAYKELEQAISDAYGVAEIGAKRIAIANKEMQLAELKRQLDLEKSRKSKNKDQEKIEDLKGQIIDLEIEIKNATNDIVNSLLGISSVGDSAEQMVSSMIKAFKNGEDYMKSYSESFESMIDNMIMKAIVGKVIGEKLEELFSVVEKAAKERADKQTITWADLTGVDAEWANMLSSFFSAGYGGYMKEDDFLPTGQLTFEQLMKYIEKKIANAENETIKKQYEGYLEKLQELYTKAALPTPDDVDSIRGMRETWEAEVKEIFEAYMEAFGIKYGQDKDSALSKLQQGIQGITEDTAGALEAYMNGVSQQVYLHSELLTQIRDTIIGFDLDIQVATLGQMLLQLQQSYQVQQSIENILQNVLNPSGRAFSVELIS